MMCKTKSFSAFTLVEVIVVLAIFLLVFGLSVLFAQTAQVRTDLRTQTATFISYARELRNASAAGKDNNFGYSIHLEEDSYTLYEGDSYLENVEGNTVISLPDVIRVQNISLQGDGQDIYFRPPFGETEQNGTFQIYSTQTGEALTVTIDRLGKVDY
ncbi:MAG: prepilin-type N-terminal cleavage/methylation domain-containing protein [Candidatus Gracilibacteria bacterium]|jgi:prepilin-type N-terminal cleavage/methylation domain-containing protein